MFAVGVHPDVPFESCTLQNERSCMFYGDLDRATLHLPTVVEVQSVAKHTTFSVEIGSPYESLQWTLVGTDHTQNEIIARQFECPPSLTLCEYKNFGSLRADGHRLQLRKLYATIETESLSFETLSVQALIMQTIWEVGPNNPLAVQWNETHEDFTDPKFATAMIDLIDKFINTQKCNWKHPLKLLMAALIAVRVFEMNDDNNVADRIAQLLVKLRDIAYDWIAKVQTAMLETETEADVEKLRMNLVEISISGAVTYFVHFRHQYFDKIFIGSLMNSITAVRFWLEFLVTISGNILLSNKKENIKTSSKLNQEMFQRLVHRIGVQLQSKLKEIITNDPSDVFEFIKSQWNRSRDGTFKLKLNAHHPETLIASITIDEVEHFVQIGIITGEFLVNNHPVSRLPKSITEHPHFQRVFEQFIFEVHQEASGRFDTKHKYKNSHYSFLGDDDEVIITERKENGDEYELIPDENFVAEIPYLLVENHSHWWCKAKKIIEFRPICFSDPNISTSEGVQYELDLNIGNLLHRKTKKAMLDVTSGSYKKIVHQLSRLESKKYIHIFMEEPQIAKIELVRMNIKFIVNQQESNDVISNEFDGMRVCCEQNCGTLYGSRHGLLLESIPDGESNMKKIMIIPHGRVNARVAGNHETVEVDLEAALRSPSFFIIQIDELCQQLKASNRSYSAWFYLAYLHALTSHGLPEPLTEMSGTERALQILQSAFAWSSAPYDDDALVTLKLIEKLAPSRRIKNNSHSVRWPDMVDTHAAQDGFLFITNQLIVDSKRLDGLHSKSPPISPPNDKNDVKNSDNAVELDANVREYFRCLPYFPNLQLSKNFIQHEIAGAAHYIHHENDHALQTIRTISNLYHQNSFISPNMFSITEYLTKNDVDLTGAQDVNDNEEILQLYSSKKVRDEWLSLYNIARSGQFSREKFALVLGLMAYGNTGVDDLNSILLLQTVAANRTIFNGIDPPEIAMYYLNDRQFNRETIVYILGKHKAAPEFRGRYNEDRQNQYVIDVQEYIHKVTNKICGMYPCEEVNASIYRDPNPHPDVNLRDAVILINKKLRHWRNIARLTDFLKNIDLQIRRLHTTRPNNNDEVLPWYPEKLPYRRLTKFYVNFDAKIVENLPLFEAEVNESEQIFSQAETVAAKDWWFVYKSIASPTDAQHLFDAGMYPRMVLSLVLPKLLSSSQNPQLKAIICAVGCRIVHEQRKRRISMYAQKPEMKALKEKEQQNEPHTNWLPYGNCESLIF